jgi:hypothetical protein
MTLKCYIDLFNYFIMSFHNEELDHVQWNTSITLSCHFIRNEEMDHVQWNTSILVSMHGI